MVRLHMNSGATMRYSNFRKDESSGEAFFIRQIVMNLQERLTYLLSYSPETGVFVWSKTRNGYVKAGYKAGSIDRKGYLRIKLDNKLYLAHRLAWIYVFGFIQEGFEIDHINGVRDDNRIANLRCVKKIGNMENQKRAHSNNKSSGLLGVSKRPSGRYQANIQSNSKRHYLGVFDTAEEAYDAYVNAKRMMHSCCAI